MTRGQMQYRIIVKKMGMKQSRRRRVAIQTVAQAEGGEAANNMLNTTESWSGSSLYNSVGVRNYRTEEDGVDATVETFKSPGHGYEKIERLLREDAPAKEIVEAWGESDWGTSKKLALEVWRMIISVPGMLRLLERKQVAGWKG